MNLHTRRLQTGDNRESIPHFSDRTIPIRIAIAITLFGYGAAAADKGEHRYPVRVTVTEVKNRIVEGRVRHHKIRVDQPKAFGADDTAPTPPEMLAFALGSCVVSTGRLLAMQQNLDVKNISVEVEGTLDFSKALGMTTTKRAGYSGFSLKITIDAPMSDKKKKKLLKEIEARCPMCDNLSNATPLTFELRRNKAQSKIEE